MPNHSKTLALFFLAFYFAIKFGLDSYWRTISEYYSYAFELVFVGVVYFVYRQFVQFRISCKEELVFRLALWEPLKALLPSKNFVLVTSALLFSVGHLIALWAVPAEYKAFVLVQTFYVILLGLGAGYRKLKTESVLSAILVHFGFNLGFYLVSFVS